MELHIGEPASVDAEFTTVKTEMPDGVCVRVRPKRFSKGQSRLYTTPISVLNDNGDVVHAAMLAVSPRTGKLVLEDRTETVECEIDVESTRRAKNDK